LSNGDFKSRIVRGEGGQDQGERDEALWTQCGILHCSSGTDQTFAFVSYPVELVLKRDWAQFAIGVKRINKSKLGRRNAENYNIF
jgi:hypothetical protein